MAVRRFTFSVEGEGRTSEAAILRLVEALARSAEALTTPTIPSPAIREASPRGSADTGRTRP